MYWAVGGVSGCRAVVLGLIIVEESPWRGGSVDSPVLSSMTFCDENDGPNADSKASAEGSGDVASFRGERGNFGLFVNDEEACNTCTAGGWDDDAVDVNVALAAAACVATAASDL